MSERVDPLARWALEAPDRPAVIMDRAGTVTTYRELHERSLGLAHQLRAWGLRRGDGIAIVAENRREYLEIAWAAQRSGLYYTAVNWHLQSAEIAYIVDDCGAAVVFTSAMLADAVDAIAAATPNVRHVVNLDGPTPSAVDTLDRGSNEPLVDACEGCELLYSSGTTGRPKAVKRPLPPPGEVLVNHRYATEMYRDRYGRDDRFRLPLPGAAVPRGAARLAR